MICPFCNTNGDKVIDSRPAESGRIIRRRRECQSCGRRFTTYERVEQTTRLMVVKRDGKRVPFSSDNILRGVQAACGKRPLSEEIKQGVVDNVEEEVHRDHEREVTSIEIGKRVMARLRQLDPVAYIRFASEHMRFQSLDEIAAEVEAISEEPRVGRGQQDLFK
ncbi:MAG: transcriptional repressor NrdR [Phycisphaeraceae bacterium]|nr:transcriptional repressor NrdR [Phycisphaeraceae bacterium]